MSGRRFYLRQETSSFNTTLDNEEELLYSNATAAETNDDENEVLANVDDGDKDIDDDSEFLHDVPYSSSSIDRSSIGSIPWADDAIKKNLLDWQHVERMLNGIEPLSTNEPELSAEILDWQQKFPQLLGKNVPLLQQQESYESTQTIQPIDNLAHHGSLTNLSLNSQEAADIDDEDDDNEEEDGFLTPTNTNTQYCKINSASAKQQMQSFTRPAKDLANILERDLHISAVKLRQREQVSLERRCHAPQQAAQQQQQFLATPASSPLQPIVLTNSAKTARNNRILMPPILNVLDSKRHFRRLLSNRSFVQLTQVQEQQQQLPHKQPSYRIQQTQTNQIKSAAITLRGSADRQQTQNYNGRSSWHMPIAAATLSSRFLNNRNAILLPSLNRQHYQQQHQQNQMRHNFDLTHAAPTTSNSSGFHELQNIHGVHKNYMLNSSSTVSSSLMNGNANVKGAFNNARYQQPTAHAYAFHQTGIVAAGSETNSTTPSTVRSISAAMQHSRADYLTSSAFYIPYSASKFKAFK